MIVDLQHKNEELKTRLEAMENGVHNGQDESLMTEYVLFLLDFLLSIFTNKTKKICLILLDMKNLS